MQNVREHLHLIWADKIALTLGVLAVVFAVLAWVFVALAAGTMGANHVLASVGTEGAVEAAAGLAALWAVMRALDFVFGGSTFKLFHAPTRASETAILPAGGNLLAH